MSDQNQTEVNETTGTSPVAKDIKANDGKGILEAKLKAPAQELKEAIVESKEEAKAESPESPSIDYKAELEKTKAKLEREKTTRQFERDARKKAEQKVRELAAPSKDEDSGETLEEALDPEEDVVDKKINAKFDALQRDLQSQAIDKFLDTLSDDEDERALIRYNYENKIKATGFDQQSIESDLKDAYFMANRPKFESQAFEKATAKVKKDMAVSSALKASAVGGAGREPPESQARFISPEEEKFLRAMGKGAMERHLNKLKQS